MCTRIFYIWDDNLIKECDRLPAVQGRASKVHELIAAYDLAKHMRILCSQPASYEEMREFHSDLYLNHLKTLKNIDDDYVISNLDEEYGIGYDCPPVANMYELASTIAGGSLMAARILTSGAADVAINWCGGWHHAQRFGAEGFCYINDIVIAIEKLRRKFPKVLYIDLDVHHGNGVENAYNLSKTVFTLSYHKLEPGFYPGSGNLNDIGTLVGKGYTVNFPLHESYSDETLMHAFKETFPAVNEYFRPDAIVLQCGADSLAHDPLGGACLTVQGYCDCVRMVLNCHKPTMILGGGGYNIMNAARLWASVTAAVVGVKLDSHIPEHVFWSDYGPDYLLPLCPSLARDANKKIYLDTCISVIRDNLKKYLGDIEESVPKRIS